MNTLLNRSAVLPLFALLPLATASAEGFVDDSTLKLQLRNVYFNENFRDEHGMSPRAVRTAKTTLKYGTLLPKTPVLIYNDARLLPQTYQGAQVTSADIDNLTLTGGHLDRFKLRDSSDSVPLVPDGYGGDKSGDFNYAGADYKLGKRVRLSYFYGELENFYRQHFAGIQHDLPLGAGVLTSDLRYFNSVDSGSAYGGKVDNHMLSGLLSYAVAGHTFNGGYQTLSGDAGLPYISGATVYSFSNVGIGKFIEEDEKTWMLGYGYDFARVGVPGLTFSTRYLSGNDGKSQSAVKEWERDAEVAYVVQSGTFKGLGVKLRNYVYRSDFSRGRDSNRIYLTYDLALW